MRCPNFRPSLTLAHRTAAGSRRAAARRGFTLVELMIVVAMVGILSALAIVGVSKYYERARSVDARGVVSAIMAAQEFYKAKYGEYANINDHLDSSADTEFYPGNPSDGNALHAWSNPSHVRNTRTTDRPIWLDLDVPITEYPGGGCVTTAGYAGEPVTDTIAGIEVAFVPDKEWYAVVCVTDLDGDGQLRYYGGSSLFTEVVSNGDRGEY